MRILFSLFLIAAFCSVNAQNVQLRSITTYPSDMADIWGYSDGEFEYALAGYEDGFSVVDVTDPDNPDILHDLPGPNTYWRDIKTYGHYAYGVHENVGFGNEGLVIMDLSQLPDALPVTYWTTDGNPSVNFRAAHNIFIDENGVAFITGHNMASGGVLMIDVATDPENPAYLGQYSESYVHDCFARNDTLWTAEVYSGQFGVIDVSDKSDPVVLARQATPLGFTHNIWVSDDGNSAFTTDERTGAFLGSYDVSDINDIKEIDRYRSGQNVIPHNAMVKDEFVVISWYSHGLIILDATFPDELVEVGRYDTAPNYPGPGFHGAWGVYPYLPSGNILVTDIEEGLVVLSPQYQNATHIRGSVINSETREIISGANVMIDGPDGMNGQTTNLQGGFKRGMISGGNFTIEVSKTGFESKTIELTVEEGEIVILEIELIPISYSPTDTIFVELPEGESLEICDEDAGGIEVDLAFTCGGITGSNLGSWTVNVSDNSGCITYTAENGSGGNTDQVCLVVQNENTGEFNVNLIVVNILASPTGIADNAFANGGFSLAQNPVGDKLSVIRKDIYSGSSFNIRVFDSNGQHVESRSADALDERISIPVDHLSSGLYIMTISSGEDHRGFVKFVKQ